MLISEILKQRRKELSWSITEASARSSISAAHISRIENGLRQPTLDVVLKLSKAYGLNLFNNVEASNKLKESDGPEYKAVSNLVPLVGNVRAGSPICAVENIESYVTVPETTTKKVDFALRVIGDSMNLLNINHADIVFVNKQSVAENGDIVIALIDNENATIKQFFQSGDTITLLPKSSNPVHMPQVYHLSEQTVTILGKITYALICV